MTGVSPETRDHVLLTLWLIVTFKQFPYDQLFLYPLAGWFVFSFIRDFPLHFPLLKRSLILFAFPTWCAASVLWGHATGDILKATAQLFLTVIVCYCAMLRLSRRQILISLLIAAGIYGVASLVLAPTGGKATRGVFASKNSMGLSMVLLWAVALCILFDSGQKRLLRGAALVLVVVAIILVFRAQSATAVLLAGGVAAIVATGLMTLHHRLTDPVVLVAVLALLAAGCIGLGLLLAAHDIDPGGLILKAFGKDATLTGRTVLWGYAVDQVREHPFLGVGAKGFWMPYDWTSISRRIYIDFHKTYDSVFTFHNSYLEIAVHQGLIGLCIAVSAFLWAVWQVVAAVLWRMEMAPLFFVIIAAVLLGRNMTEPGLMSPFSLMTMVLYMGALLALRDRLAGRGAG